MAAKVKIEMMNDEEQQHVGTLPPISDLPVIARPVDPLHALKKASGIGAPPAKASPADFPYHGPDTPVSRWMNAPLGVKQKLDAASQALRDRGHHVLAHLTDLAGQVAPDSAASLANAALLGYGAASAVRSGASGAVPEGAPAEEPAPAPEAAIGTEAPTPPAPPPMAMPEPAPVTAGGAKPTATFAYDWPEAGGPQYHIEGGPYDGSTVSGAKLKTLGIEAPPPGPAGSEPNAAQARVQARLREQYINNRNDPRDLRTRPGISPTQAPSPTFQNRSPVREALDAAKKAAPIVAGAGALGAIGAGEASASDPEYQSKEDALIKAMAATGHPIMKVGGDRTADQQAKLYQQGRGKPGSIVTDKSGAPGDESRHQVGMAGDFAFVGPDGKPDYSPTQPWATLGRMAKVQGLEWGGDFKDLNDRGHVQLPVKAQAPGQTPAPAPAPGAPASTAGIKIEPMTSEDHQGAPAKPLWRQVMDPIAESAPLVMGATGGMLGGIAGAPTGPGAALGAVGGAYTGGVIGEGLRTIYRRLTGQDLHQPTVQTLDTLSASGRNQMYQEMLGLGVASALTSRAATKAFGSAAATATNAKYALKMSAADLSDSPVGRGLAQVMNYVSASAKAATDAARRVGLSNAEKAITDALNNLTSFHSNLDVGRDIQAGVRAGATGLKEGPIGELYDKVKQAGPPIDLRPQIQSLLQTFETEGTPAAARRALLRLFPKPTNTLTAPVRWGSTDPYMVTFEQAAKLRTRLGTQGRKALSTIGTDATSLATKLYGDLSQALVDAHPDFGSASNLWRDARQSLSQRFVAATLKTSPDQIVKALGPTPSTETVDALRKTMLNLAQSAGPNTPEGAAGSQGFEALRRSWFDTHILRDSAGKADPIGMLDRMKKANGAMRGFFGINQYDTYGHQLLDTATQIGQALKRQVPIKSPSPYTRGAELLGLLEVAARAGAGTAAKTVAGVELLPGFITWAMHRPAVAKAFVTGLTNSHTIQGAALLGRTLAGYFASGGPEADPEPDPNDPENLPPYQPGGGTATTTPTAPSGPKPQARVTPSPTDPMGGASININTWDPEATGSPPPAQVARAQAPNVPGPAALQPKATPSAWMKASTIGATQNDPYLTARRADEEWAQVPPAVVKAVGDKIRHWGEDVGAYSKSTEDWLLASLGGAFVGATEGVANALEQNLTPEAVATGMVPLHEVEPLAELTRSLGRSAEGLPGLYSRLTRAVEAVPEISARKGVAGMVDPKKVLEAVKTANPDEVAWKEVVPFLRQHMAENGERTPIAKQAVLDYLEKRKIKLTSTTSGQDRTHWEDYAVPGPGGHGNDRMDYRENRIAMPGQDPDLPEGGNLGVNPKTFHADIHRYPEQNIVSTARMQNYELPAWQVEGRPDPSAITPEQATPESVNAAAADYGTKLPGVLLDEIQSDIHEEAGRVYERMLREAREKEVGRRVTRSQGALTEEQALEQVPKRAFAKRHFEIVDPDAGGKVLTRFLNEDDAKTWLDVEKANFPNAEIRPTKGLSPLEGYQTLRPSDPKVHEVFENLRVADEARDEAYRQTEAINKDYIDAVNALKNKAAKEAGYPSFRELKDLQYQYGIQHQEARTQSLALEQQINDEVLQDPSLTTIRARIAESEAASRVAHGRYQQAYNAKDALGVKTGAWQLTQRGEGPPVPDLPFKDTGDWSALALKHNLLTHTAETPEETTFFGHVGGGEHADRYDLRHHLSEIRFDPQEKDLILFKNGREIHRIDTGTATPSRSFLQEKFGEEVGSRLYQKIQDYEPVYDNNEGLPGTEYERDRADEHDYQQGWDQEFNFQRDQHSVDEVEVPVLDDEGEPKLDEDGDPETETKWRVFEDDQYDKDDPDTYEEFDTEREAHRHLERRLDSIMDSYEHEPSEDRYDHLDPDTTESESGYPRLTGLDLHTGGKGMLTFYDEQIKRRVESLLKPFGGTEMVKVPIPGQSNRTTYAWVTKLTPEMKQAILKAGFSLMGVALALRNTNAPQSVKDAVMRTAVMQTRKSQQRTRPPVSQGAHP